MSSLCWLPLASAALSLVLAYRGDDLWPIIEDLIKSFSDGTKKSPGETKSKLCFTLFERDKNGAARFFKFSHATESHQD